MTIQFFFFSSVFFSIIYLFIYLFNGVIFFVCLFQFELSVTFLTWTGGVCRGPKKVPPLDTKVSSGASEMTRLI